MEKAKVKKRIYQSIVTVLFLGIAVYLCWDFQTEEMGMAHKAAIIFIDLIVGAVWLFGDELLSKVSQKAQRIICVLHICLMPAYIFLTVELPANELFFQNYGLKQLVLNLCICALVGIALICILPGNYIALDATIFLTTAVGVINSAVIQFRTYPIAPSDVISVGTAIAVAGGYSVAINYKIIESVLVMLWVMGVFEALRKNEMRLPWFTPKKYLIRLGIAILSFGGLILWVQKVDFIESYGLVNYEWDPRLTYEETGFPLAFTVQCHELIVEKPKGYEKTEAENLLEEYENGQSFVLNTEEFGNQNPVVISIMNESFTDFDVISEFADSEEILDFYYSLQEDEGTVEYGNVYVSTRGGGTCKSEFEYLTGYSMQFLPSTMPYMMYNFSGMENMVANYKTDGYTTIAIHPFFANDWKRNSVYPALGFDEFLYAADFEDDDYKDVREYETDEGTYLKILEQIEEHENEPVFIFDVTLQNHGGYDIETFSDIAKDISKPYDEYTDLSVFEGMMAESDDALEMLITELKKLDRPVIVTFFGDHQPSLDTAFDDEILANGSKTKENDAELVQRLYATPYFIWTNYDVDKSYITYDQNNEMLLSTNYLGVMTRYYSGGKLSAMEEFLLQSRQSMPVLNSIGYYVNNDTWYSVEEKSSLEETLQTRISDYSKLQYLLMFD